MATIEIKIPSPGESITQVELSRWLVKEGDSVRKNTEIAELESDKATLMLVAEESGKISFKAAEGDMLEVGSIACTIDTSVEAGGAPQPDPAGSSDTSQPSVEEAGKSTEPAPAHDKGEDKETADMGEEHPEGTTGTGKDHLEDTAGTREDGSENTADASESVAPGENGTAGHDKVKITPLAKKVMESHDLSVDDVLSGLRRLKREDVEASMSVPGEASNVPGEASTRGGEGFKKAASRTTKSNRLSSLRRKLSERLVSVKNETAMLTTFNEVDMKAIMDIRKKHQNAFVEAHGIKLGFMSFFLKACSVALQEFPQVNAMIDGENLVTYEYVDISVAVSAPKGLMVPVVRNVESLGLAEIERAIADLAKKAHEGKLSIPEMSGGTFTVTNGGIFGSMLSTPLINPPQSAILGMHNIIDRPVAIDGQVVIRPMMYVALSYDHRVIDGKDSVSFLVRVKQLLENPTGMLYVGGSPEKQLLEL